MFATLISVEMSSHFTFFGTIWWIRFPLITSTRLVIKFIRKLRNMTYLYV